MFYHTVYKMRVRASFSDASLQEWNVSNHKNSNFEKTNLHASRRLHSGTPCRTVDRMNVRTTIDNAENRDHGKLG